MFSKFRVFLIPAGALCELFILGVAWVVALVSKGRGERIVDWATATLPDIDWYLGNR